VGADVEGGFPIDIGGGLGIVVLGVGLAFVGEETVVTGIVVL
jgi:hypothetical protein